MADGYVTSNIIPVHEMPLVMIKQTNEDNTKFEEREAHSIKAVTPSMDKNGDRISVRFQMEKRHEVKKALKKYIKWYRNNYPMMDFVNPPGEPGVGVPWNHDCQTGISAAASKKEINEAQQAKRQS